MEILIYQGDGLIIVEYGAFLCIHNPPRTQSIRRSLKWNFFIRTARWPGQARSTSWEKKPEDKTDNSRKKDICIYIMSRPPVTLKTWPVIQPALSEARKTMALAISSGRPNRPMGIVGKSSSSSSLSM